MRGKDLIAATLFGGAGGSSGGGGIPQADIDAAFAALAEKGVTVPDGATSADLDDLIASIVTGGGATIFGRTVETGTVTPATTVDNLKVNHSLGIIPTGAIWWTEEDAFADTSNRHALIGCAIFHDDVSWYSTRALVIKKSAATTSSVAASGMYKTGSGDTGMAFPPAAGTASGATIYNLATTNSVNFCTNSEGHFVAGVQYKYILFGGIPK